ncbi:MAG: hypothetical protein HC817_16665 [Saprospiraceae bacterium]|nr:hypothetical protein [Saprospiraceae bacterium]
MQQHKLMVTQFDKFKIQPLMRFSVLITLLFSVAILRGQTIYVGPDNGDWLTAANWSNGLPASGNNATVSGGKIVEINGTLAIGYMVDNFGTIINKGTTTVSGNLSSGGAFTNEATASLTVTSSGLVLVAGGFSNAGTVTNRGTVTVEHEPPQ